MSFYDLDDPKEKFFYLSMEADHSGALDPIHKAEIFGQLSKNYDFKFKVVHSFQELCSEIKSAGKSGELPLILVDGHGTPNGMHISGDSANQDNWIHRFRSKSELAKCFEDVVDTKIILTGCEVSGPLNGNPKTNFANHLAESIQNEIITWPENFYPYRFKMTSVKPFKFTHRSEDFSKENVYDTFNEKIKTQIN